MNWHKSRRYSILIISYLPGKNRILFLELAYPSPVLQQPYHRCSYRLGTRIQHPYTAVVLSIIEVIQNQILFSETHGKYGSEIIMTIFSLLPNIYEESIFHNIAIYCS